MPRKTWLVLLTVQSCWMLMTRCCTAAASGPAPPSPRRSPPCPRRFESEERSRHRWWRPADALRLEPSVTRCVPDAPRRLGFGGGGGGGVAEVRGQFNLEVTLLEGRMLAVWCYLSTLSSPRLLEESRWASAASPPSSPVTSVWFSNCWMIFLTLPGRTTNTKERFRLNSS